MGPQLTDGDQEWRHIESERLSDHTYRWEVVAMLWRKYGKDIQQYCATWLSGEQAKEVAQDVLVTVWYRLPDYRPDKPIKMWLLGIARHTCQRALRNQMRRQTIVQTCCEAIRDQTHTVEAILLEHLVVQARQYQRLYDCFAKLSAEEQTLLTWWYWKELPLREIATLLDKSISVVRKRLTRAEQHLKGFMNDSMTA